MLPGPLASGELLALSVTVVQPSSWLSFRGQIKTSPACLFKGSTPYGWHFDIIFCSSFPYFWFSYIVRLIHYSLWLLFYSMCYPRPHDMHLFFNSKWWWRDSYAEASLRETWHEVWLKKDRILLNYFTTGEARAQVREQGRSFVQSV